MTDAGAGILCPGLYLQAGGRRDSVGLGQRQQSDELPQLITPDPFLATMAWRGRPPAPMREIRNAELTGPSFHGDDRDPAAALKCQLALALNDLLYLRLRFASGK